jgi:hypothetical protein
MNGKAGIRVLSGVVLALVGCAAQPSYEVTCVTPDQSSEAMAKRIFRLAELPASAKIIRCETVFSPAGDHGDHRETCALRVDPQDFAKLLSNRTYSEKPYEARSGFIGTFKVEPGEAIATRYYLHNEMYPGHMVYANADRTYVIGYFADYWCGTVDQVIN